jgi:transcription elongation GreA/GreB family factor
MNKTELLQRIIAQLSLDLEVLFNAAKTAHDASINEETQPDNKYDTLALEASYVAQGQANRAQELRKSIEIYKQLKPHGSNIGMVRLTSLVTLEDADGKTKTVFIGPIEGGLKIKYNEEEIVVITPVSPMGRELLGKGVGDAIEIETGNIRTEYEIVEVS